MSVDGKLATCSACGVDLGAGDCWDCHEVRTKLELAGFLKHSVYHKLQWKSVEDQLVREKTLAATKEELTGDGET